MAVVSTVTIGATEVTILPGTFTYENRPIVVSKPNEPTVVIANRYRSSFEADVDNAASIESSDQGPGANTLTVTGFDTISLATIDVGVTGEGIQKKRIQIHGTKSS